MSGNTSMSAPGTSGRIVSACVGSSVVALAVTPLDVAKIRMQASTPPQKIFKIWCCPSLGDSQMFFASNGITEHCFEKRDPRWRYCFVQRTLEASAPKGLLGTLRQIAAEGGLVGLYAGLPTTLVIGIPSNVIYFSSYEAFRDRLTLHFSQLAGVAPVIAGGASRAVAVTVCAPLEVVRTRIQAGRLTGTGGLGGALELRTILQREGFAGMFRGLLPTLWRDVPFSAFYWFGVEAIRARLLRRGWWEGYPMQNPLVALVAGSSAGAVAAFCTTPFDVVKTRTQVMTASSREPTVRGMWPAMARIAREEGTSVLLVGAAPRVARVAPACAIMLGTYEVTKLLLGTHQPVL